MSKTKIFVSAYACEPDHGSEIGVGWHWVLEMSKRFELWVLTRESNRCSIEPWISSHPDYSGIHFIYYDLPRWARWWKKGQRGVRIYYNIWQRMTDHIVRSTMQHNGILIYHLLTYGNALWPASHYGQRQFFIWGPIGGVDTISSDFTRHYGFRWQLIEKTRLIIVNLLPYNRGFQQRCKNARLILCKSHSMKEAVDVKYRDKAILFTDVATDLCTPSPDRFQIENTPSNTINYLIVGRLDAWRGFDLAIEALSEALQVTPHLHLNILGQGSDLQRLVKLVSDLHLESHVTFWGNVPISEYQRHLACCDVVLNPCLKEGAVTTAFDSLSYGKPLICIDTGGYTRYFSPAHAIVISKQKRSQVIKSLSEAILKLSDKTLRDNMGREALQKSQDISWESKGNEICSLISDCWNHRPQSSTEDVYNRQLT